MTGRFAVPPIPEAFLARAASPEWWAFHLLLEEGFPFDLAANLLWMPLPDDAALLLEVSSFFSEVGLAVGGKAAQLGWDDWAEFFPHVFRWQEVRAICDYVAARVPWDAHADLPVALLHRFVVVTDDDTAAQMRAEVTPVLRRLGLDDEQVEDAIGARDYRPGPRQDDTLVGPGWVPDPVVGWRLDLWRSFWLERLGDGAPRAPYSLRVARQPRVPRRRARSVLAALGVA